jgi:hypothetical protein
MQSFQKPDEYFRLLVEGNLTDYWEKRDDIRCAFNAAVACLAMRDWMLASRPCHAARRKFGRKKNPQNEKRAYRISRYTAWIVRREPALREIIDIANCAKHFQLDRGPSQGRSVGSIGWGYFAVGDPVGMTLRPLRVECRAGDIMLFQDLLLAAVSYWRRTKMRPTHVAPIPFAAKQRGAAAGQGTSGDSTAVTTPDEGG